MPVQLPGPGAVRIAGVALPHGRPLPAGTASSREQPVLWATDSQLAAAAQLWRTMADQPEPGLTAVLLEGYGADHSRPWDKGDFGPVGTGEAPDLGSELVLAEMWARAVPADGPGDAQERDDLLSPYASDWPGLAPAVEARADDKLLAAALEAQPPARLGLVLARRPADIPVAVGWLGAANYGSSAAQVSAVLRSWEDRFDARLLKIGFQTMYLLVGRPPATIQSALAIAAEYFAFCPDSVFQGAGSVSGLAEQLVDATVWAFWWD
jgi:Domain of unknown function (DUF4253)